MGAEIACSLTDNAFVNNREQFNFLIEESLNFRNAEIGAFGV